MLSSEKISSSDDSSTELNTSMTGSDRTSTCDEDLSNTGGNNAILTQDSNSVGIDASPKTSNSSSTHCSSELEKLCGVKFSSSSLPLEAARCTSLCSGDASHLVVKSLNISFHYD